MAAAAASESLAASGATAPGVTGSGVTGTGVTGTGVTGSSALLRVSVIIPVLNEESRVVSAVERAVAAGAWEVIVVDGGSRDRTVALAAATPCRVLESPAGRAVQQNRGAAAAGGEILLFLHADTWLPAGAVAQVVQLAESGETVVGAFAQRIEASAYVYRLVESGNALRVRLFGLAYGDQGIFLSRDLFQRLGGFPEVPLMEDVRLMRSVRRQQRLHLLPGPLHVSPRRWQRHGLVRQTLRNWLLLCAERLGVSPARLARFYPTCTDSPASNSADPQP
ncbi:MAG: glycosyltransferase [Planctomycetota bacterium]|nr:MAG: glycosyltransferase [Planctomycetota bacterium]